MPYVCIRHQAKHCYHTAELMHVTGTGCNTMCLAAYTQSFMSAIVCTVAAGHIDLLIVPLTMPALIHHQKVPDISCQ